jgi:hypothetical protein
MDDPVILSRIQFAFTVTYHYLFPQLTMGLAFLIAVLKTLAIIRKAEIYNEGYLRCRRERGHDPIDIALIERLYELLDLAFLGRRLRRCRLRTQQEHQREHEARAHWSPKKGTDGRLN